MVNRTTAVVVAMIFISAVLILPIVAYEKGFQQGYKKLEVELVYAIAGDRNKFIGNFYVIKDPRMNTVIGVYEPITVTEQKSAKKKGEKNGRNY